MTSKSDHDAFLEQVKAMRNPTTTKAIQGQIKRSQSDWKSKNDGTDELKKPMTKHQGFKDTWARKGKGK